MARNQEKAQTMLARWLRYREPHVKEPVKKRPFLAEMCDNLHEAEKWRGQIIKEISKNVSDIQNASLGEHKIRDLNDRINKLFREKRHWERRIKELGGHSYAYRMNNKNLEGMSVGSAGGYLYFGAAKDLPGVRELLEVKKKDLDGDQTNKEGEDNKLTRKQMYDMINCDYYGFGDDDDNDLYWREQQQEQKLRLAKIEAWEKQTGKKTPQNEIFNYNYDENDNIFINNNNEQHPWKKRKLNLNPNKIPSQEEIDAIILQKKKNKCCRKNMHKIHQNQDN